MAAAFAHQQQYAVIPPIRLASYDRAQFSPDGNYIYFRRSGGADDSKRFDLYRVAVLGGTASLLARDVDSSPTFSADGQRMAILRDNNPTMGKYQILILDRDGRNEKPLITEDHPTPINPAWSPDGKVIACFEGCARQESNRSDNHRHGHRQTSNSCPAEHIQGIPGQPDMDA